VTGILHPFKAKTPKLIVSRLMAGMAHRTNKQDAPVDDKGVVLVDGVHIRDLLVQGALVNRLGDSSVDQLPATLRQPYLNQTALVAGHVTPERAFWLFLGTYAFVR
jgi:hypothetical protein